uniref:Reverse transcriptase zinc-binding domain-containing protein n=1 Tax=Amphimedon queenslandica TaxID=400682 RepID=A0A1X7UFF2_AMPQE
MTLCRWKYRTDSSCGLCNAPQCTVNHILSCCPTSLLQGRYTWRHDTVLKRLYNLLRDNLDESVTIFADLNNLRASDTPPATIPLNIIVTTARPDIVIIDGRYICLLELTIPSNNMASLTNARERKQRKENYISLVSDLSSRGYATDLETVEIGALGHFLQCSINSIQQVLPHLSKRFLRNSFISQLSFPAISCSYAIFNSRHNSEWSPPI